MSDSGSLLTSGPLRLETARLVLMPCPAAIARAVLEGAPRDRRIGGLRFPAGWPQGDLREVLPGFASTLEADSSRLGWGVWLVILPAEQTVIGDCGFIEPPDRAGTVEIGYSILPAYRGLGYAFEAARELVYWAFRQPGVRRVIAHADPDNAPSLRILEKLGMRRTGLEEGLTAWAIERPEIRGLHHVQITIPAAQEPAARRFYCDVLGLREIDKPGALKPRGGFWVAVGEQQVHVSLEEGVDRRATKAHIAYQVTDLGAWRARLAAEGIPVGESVPIPGYNRLEFRDPFGNRIELIQPSGAARPDA